MNKANILIVEDETITAHAYAVVIKSIGYHVCSVADSCQKAVEIAAKEDPDLAIMDIGLEGDLDGIKCAEILRRRFGLPILFVTGYVDEEIRQKASVKALDEFLVKPIGRDDLATSIESALNRSFATKLKNEPV